MKTVNFATFAKDKIKEKELNYLKGGYVAADEDLLTPPER